MLINLLLGKAAQNVAPHVPVVGSIYEVGKICIRVYQATMMPGIIGTPPVIRYPSLCLAALACAVVDVTIKKLSKK